MEKISSFVQEHSFLSNDHICLVYYEGLLFPSVSHAFQAARSTSPELKEKISKIHDIEFMYELAVDIEDPPRWSKDRVKIMEILIRDKFRRNPVLRQRLIDTGSAIIQNSYESSENQSNLFWGTVHERGENIVGKILTKIRTDLKNETELDKWLLMSFDLVCSIPEIPRIILHEYKDNTRLRRIYLEDKPYYTIGSALDCDFKLSHNTIDPYHAVLANDKTLGVILIDLNSTSGTFIKENRIRKLIAAPLDDGELISFGEKKKVYKLEIYIEHVRREYEKKISDVDKELKMLEMMQNPTKDIESIKETLGMTKVSKIKVENIPRKACHEREMKELFNSLGEILDVYVPRRGYEAFIMFKTPESAEAAVKWNGMMFQNRRLKISLDKTRKRSRSRSPS